MHTTVVPTQQSIQQQLRDVRQGPSIRSVVIGRYLQPANVMLEFCRRVCAPNLRLYGWGYTVVSGHEPRDCQLWLQQPASYTKKRESSPFVMLLERRGRHTLNNAIYPRPYGQKESGECPPGEDRTRHASAEASLACRSFSSSTSGFMGYLSCER